jgi:amino acid transporter
MTGVATAPVTTGLPKPPPAGAGEHAARQESRLAATQELESFGYKQELKRSLNVWELTAFGLNYMIPTAPAIIFGIILTTSKGTVAIPYAIAGVAMVFTALSYGAMVQNFPLAGSIFNYVSRGINEHVGFLAGWVLILDYVLIPTVTSVSASLYIREFFPQVPFWTWLLLFAVAMGLLNLFGVELMAKLGLWLLLLGEVVIFVGFVWWCIAAHHYHYPIITSKPFHVGSFSGVMTATSVAVLSYLGFDAITTLSEETDNPRRDVPRAVYLSVIFGAGTMILTGYFGMLLIPDWARHANDSNWVNTTLFQVAKLVPGSWFHIFYTTGYLIAMGVFNVVATAAGARLLYGMGRDGMLPRSFFGKINKRFATPHYNIIVIVVLEYILGIWLGLERISTLINYGALGGFAALNFGVFYLYYVKKTGVSPLKLGNTPNWRPTGWQHLRFILCPFLGVAIVVWVWTSMDHVTLVVGTSWLIIGIVYEAILTKGWRTLPPKLEV